VAAGIPGDRATEGAVAKDRTAKALSTPLVAIRRAIPDFLAIPIPSPLADDSRATIQATENGRTLFPIDNIHVSVAEMSRPMRARTAQRYR
jgi:hypothetical protein